MEKGQISARELEIMYTLDVVDEYGSCLDSSLQDHEVSAAEIEDLLRGCCDMMPRVSESQNPISKDTWIGLGKIRDGLVELVEKKLGAEHNLSKVLNFNRLDSEEISLLSKSMSNMWESAPCSFSWVTKNGISIIQDIINAWVASV